MLANMNKCIVCLFVCLCIIYIFPPLSFIDNVLISIFWHNFIQPALLRKKREGILVDVILTAIVHCGQVTKHNKFVKK